MKAFRTMAVLAAFSIVAGCKNTADGAKKDAEIAADKSAEAAAKTGDAVAGARAVPRDPGSVRRTG